MRNKHSKPLYELYLEGKKFFDRFIAAIDYIAEGEGASFEDDDDEYGSPFRISVPRITKRNLNNFANCNNLKYVYDELITFEKSWTSRVTNILNELPQYSFRIRFEDARDVKYDGTMSYMTVELSNDMETVIEKATEVINKVLELPIIIEEYEKSIYSPADFKDAQSAQTVSSDEQAAFVFDYEPISGIARVNGLEVHRCQLDSVLDRTLIEAVRKPLSSIATKKNITASIHQFKIPKELRNMMFRTSATSLMLKPKITKEEIKNAGLNEDEVLAALKELTSQKV